MIIWPSILIVLNLFLWLIFLSLNIFFFCNVFRLILNLLVITKGTFVSLLLDLILWLIVWNLILFFSQTLIAIVRRNPRPAHRANNPMLNRLATYILRCSFNMNRLMLLIFIKLTILITLSILMNFFLFFIISMFDNMMFYNAFVMNFLWLFLVFHVMSLWDNMANSMNVMSNRLHFLYVMFNEWSPMLNISVSFHNNWTNNITFFYHSVNC